MSVPQRRKATPSWPTCFWQKPSLPARTREGTGLLPAKSAETKISRDHLWLAVSASLGMRQSGINLPLRTAELTPGIRRAGLGSQRSEHQEDLVFCCCWDITVLPNRDLPIPVACTGPSYPTGLSRGHSCCQICSHGRTQSSCESSLPQVLQRCIPFSCGMLCTNSPRLLVAPGTVLSVHRTCFLQLRTFPAGWAGWVC